MLHCTTTLYLGFLFIPLPDYNYCFFENKKHFCSPCGGDAGAFFELSFYLKLLVKMFILLAVSVFFAQLRDHQKMERFG